MANRTVISLFLVLAVVSYCRGQGVKSMNPIRRVDQARSGQAKPLNPSGHSPVPSPQAAYLYPTYPYPRPAPYPYPAPIPYPIYPYPAPKPAPPTPVIPDTGSKITCDICDKVDVGFKAIMERLDEIEKKIEEGGDVENLLKDIKPTEIDAMRIEIVVLMPRGEDLCRVKI